MGPQRHAWLNIRSSYKYIYIHREMQLKQFRAVASLPHGSHAFSPFSPTSAPALGGANDAEDCCLSVTQRPIPGNIVKAFRHLLIQDGCRVPAVV